MAVVDQQESSVEERPALVVQPLNVVVDMDLVDQIGQSLNDQMKKLTTELRALARGSSTNDDAKPKDNDANKGTGERKRGRKPNTELIGPISVNFELPEICFENNLDLDMMLATQGGERNRGENYVPRFTVTERLQNWTMKLRKRKSGTGGDVYYNHLPSQQRFRSKPEVTQFVLYEAPPPKPIVKKNKKSKRRRLAKDQGSASSASIKMIENSSDDQPHEMERENKSMVEEGEKQEVRLENRMIETSANHPQEVEMETKMIENSSDDQPQEMEMEKNMVSDPVGEEGEKAGEVQLKNKKIESSSDDHPQEITIEDKMVNDPMEKEGEKPGEVQLENRKIESSSNDHPQEIERSSNDHPQEIERSSNGDHPQEIESSSNDHPREIERSSNGDHPQEVEMEDKMLESSSADHRQEIEVEDKIMSTDAMMEEYERFVSNH